MISLIPTYIVAIKPSPEAEQGLAFRVPRDRLENFISVLIFNNFTAMTINLEEPTNAIAN